MYSKIKKIEGVESLKVVFVEQLFCIVSRINSNIQVYDLDNLRLKWDTKNRDYTCEVLKDIIAGTNLYLYNFEGKLIHQNNNNEEYTLEFSDAKTLLLYKTVDEEKELVRFHIFDSVGLIFIRISIELSYPLFFKGENTLVYRDFDSFLFEFNIIGVFNWFEESKIWSLNIRPLYFDKKEVNIESVKEYHDSLIVITTAGVLRLSVSDGSVIWKTDGYVRTLEIAGNMGYVCTGGSLFKINLDTGEESGYGWDCDGLPRFAYKGITFRASGHEVVYHDGLLWYSVYSSGHSFLIAINIDNGNYEWVHHVDTNEKTRAPQFYGDKMFLSDSGGFLHIYEKDK